jgi:hypothetical protein
MRPSTTSRILAAIVCCCLASCQNDNTPVGVVGRVTLDGGPLPNGVIVFESLDATRGQNRQATIENGVFALPDAEGILPGTEFRVIIRAFRKTGRKLPYPDPTGSWDETEQYLPAEYNTATTLKVTASGDPAKNEYTFDLRSRLTKK